MSIVRPRTRNKAGRQGNRRDGRKGEDAQCGAEMSKSGSRSKSGSSMYGSGRPSPIRRLGPADAVAACSMAGRVWPVC